ncbi:MAG: hypothetical protein M1587_09475 [Thaumarchaeota archaeon]|nr:hypothetical protein [Nitrososphaerota archaeon]
MVNILVDFALTVLATFIPLYLGLYFSVLAGKSSRKGVVLFAALSSGIMFWFFLDVMNDSALLDVNEGFSGNYTHVLLASLFAVSVLLLFGLDRHFASSIGRAQAPDPPQVSLSYSATSNIVTFSVAAIVALGIGFHALGEGFEIGAIAPNSASIIEAIGGLGPGIAYVIHKILEGFVIGVFALIGRSSKVRNLGILGLIAGIPTLIGFPMGLQLLTDPTYFFALGGAATIYVEYKLVPIFVQSELKYVSILPALLGFYLMYLAGLFHG